MFLLFSSRINVAMLFCIYIILLIPNQNIAQASIAQAKGKIKKLLNDDFFESSTIAVIAHDLTTGKTIYQKNSKLLLHPASTNKILTTSAALLFLGPNYEFKTSFYYNGEIRDSICYGDLFVVGGGDPDFTSFDLDSSIAEIKKFGIKAVTGNLYGDISMLDSIYWGKGWMWDDDPSLDSPYLTPLIINDVGIKVFYEPAAIGELVNISLEPNTKTLSIINSAVTTKKDTFSLDISRNWMAQENQIIVSGELYHKFKRDSLSINLIHPEFHFLSLLIEALEKNEIRFGGFADTLSLPDSAKLILTHTRPLTEVIKNLNKTSDNLSAEMVLRVLGYEFEGKHASFDDGLNAIYKMLEGIGYKEGDYRIVDGSGLSHYNLVTAGILNDVLKYFYNNNPELFKIIYDSFPIAGIDGTLKRRMKRGNSFANVHAKTGTLSGVSCLAGYLNSQNNHLISFVILVQNHVDNTRKARKIQDQICEILAGIE